MLQSTTLLRSVPGAVLLIAAASAGAGLIDDPYFQTVEMMKHTQFSDGVALARYFGPDALSPIQVTTRLDPENRSFAYSAVSGSTYLGQALTLETSGEFNETSQQWETTSSASLGLESWSQTGFGDYADPGLREGNQHEFNFAWWSGLFDLHIGVDWVVFPDQTDSVWEISFTVLDIPVATARGWDVLSPAGFEWGCTAVEVGGTQFSITGFGTSGIGDGVSWITTDIPASGTIGVLGVGVVWVLRRRRRRG